MKKWVKGHNQVSSISLTGRKKTKNYKQLNITPQHLKTYSFWQNSSCMSNPSSFSIQTLSEVSMTSTGPP